MPHCKLLTLSMVFLDLLFWRFAVGWLEGFGIWALRRLGISGVSAVYALSGSAIYPRQSHSERRNRCLECAKINTSSRYPDPREHLESGSQTRSSYEVSP